MLKFLSIAIMIALTACVQSHPPDVMMRPAGFTIKDAEVITPAAKPRTWHEELNGAKPERPPIRPVMITRVFDWKYSDNTWKEYLR